MTPLAPYTGTFQSPLGASTISSFSRYLPCFNDAASRTKGTGTTRTSTARCSLLSPIHTAAENAAAAIPERAAKAARASFRALGKCGSTFHELAAS